eukprot:CAMPEP_0170174640 /NCGR_PEP_ID=MMETSP0040_2-20121228/7838_1 /TAXON_ID=641309 /ORGANISM="Lotharella oceanica, Strain CCMP622" /LENGTH=30 /DNA_ID= /DNA_START= /DNA_END= /DNA_ORIENTATION=
MSSSASAMFIFCMGPLMSSSSLRRPGAKGA